jgi:uncharacterized protein DUF1499
MRSPVAKIVLVVLLAAAAWAALAWPHVNRVETGRTPEYPDLQPREYAAGPREVTGAVEASVQRLGWNLIGGGTGKGGGQTLAVASVARIPFDVFIHVKTAHGKSVVSVKSESRHGKWDFGQNARNIRAFYNELDRNLSR